MKIKLGDWLNSINVGKNNLMEGGENIEDYSPFIINKCMASHIDTLFIASEMNVAHYLDKDIQYNYYLHVVKKKRRFAQWIKSSSSKDLEIVKEYYNYSDKKAKEALKILSSKDLDIIRSELYRGGI